MNQLYVTEIGYKNNPDPDSYVNYLPIVRQLARQGGLTLRRPVTFLVGENGSGKSTLLEAVAVAYGFNAEGGNRNYFFSTKATHSPLHSCLRLSKGVRASRDGFFLRAESFYNLATEVERLEVEEYFGDRSLHEQSHGESFLTLVLERFRGQGLYILDEPEAALSPSHQLTLLARIRQLVEDSSQFLIATHSPILMAYPEADIYELGPEGFNLTNYRDTEHYQLTRRFLENPERMLKYLFEDEK